MTVTIFITAVLNSIFDPDLATKAYFEYCKKRFHEKGIPVEVKDLEGSMYDLVYSHFQNIISVLKTDIHERLVAPFEQTLIEFSTIKPVLAYQLRGKEKLEALIAHTNEYSNDYQNVVSNEIKQ